MCVYGPIINIYRKQWGLMGLSQTKYRIIHLIRLYLEFLSTKTLNLCCMYVNVEQRERERKVEQFENSGKINICRSNSLLTKYNQSDDNNHLKQLKC